MSNLENQSVLSESDYKDIATEQNESAEDLVNELADTSVSPEEHAMSEEDLKAAQASVKNALKGLKRRLKPHSKSELITLLFQQGAQLQETRQLAQKLYEDNIKLIKELENKNDKND